MNLLKSILLCFILLINFISNAQITDKNYRIYSVKLGKEVTLTEIAEDMENYDVLFFGEEHNDSVTHYLENKMLEAMFLKFGNDVMLSMEMFDRDVQLLMNEYLQDFIKEKKFTKDARIWSNYRDYRPMVEFSKKNNLTVVCANAPSRYTNLAGRKGQSELKKLSPEAKKYFAPLPYDTASGKYYDKLMGLTHDAVPSKDTSAVKMPPPPPMFMGGFRLNVAQSLWDASMAYSISEYLKKNKSKKVMQVNGRFHSDEGFAVATQLKKYCPKSKSLIISSCSDESFPNIDWNNFKNLGDYILITDPNVPKTYD